MAAQQYPAVVMSIVVDALARRDNELTAAQNEVMNIKRRAPSHQYGTGAYYMGR